jgi:outer membrane protein TolC
VADAVHRAQNALSLLELFDTDILARADAALKLAEKAFHAGSSSLLELLEAERTDVDVKQQYLDATTQYRQALIDVAHAAGDDSP